MKVFLLDADVNQYELLVHSNQEDSKRILDWFCGEPIGDRWTPLKVEVYGIRIITGGHRVIPQDSPQTNRFSVLAP